MAHAAPGVTPVDSSEEGAPVRALMRPSVLGEPLVDSLQEPMPVEKRLEYAIQATASVWEPLGVSPEYENEYDSYFVVRGGVETTVIYDHMRNLLVLILV